MERGAFVRKERADRTKGTVVVMRWNWFPSDQSVNKQKERVGPLFYFKFSGRLGTHASGANTPRRCLPLPTLLLQTQQPLLLPLLHGSKQPPILDNGERVRVCDRERIRMSTLHSHMILPWSSCWPWKPPKPSGYVLRLSWPAVVLPFHLLFRLSWTWAGTGELLEQRVRLGLMDGLLEA